jgi:hypothetical protein
LEALDDLIETLVCLFARGDVEDLADRGRNHRLLRATNMAEHLAQETDGAAHQRHPITLAIALRSPWWASDTYATP